MGKPLENQIIVACGSTEPSFIYAAMKAYMKEGFYYDRIGFCFGSQRFNGGARIGRIRSCRFLCVRIHLSVQKEKSERISHLEDTVRIILICERVIKRSRIEVKVSKSGVAIKNIAYTPVLLLIH